MEPTGPTKPFLTIPEFGALIGVGRARAYQVVRELGVGIRLSERRWVVPRRVLDELGAPAVERARQNAARIPDR